MGVVEYLFVLCVVGVCGVVCVCVWCVFVFGVLLLLGFVWALGVGVG